MELAYICAECGCFGFAKVDCLDTGTTFTCDTCQGKTVIQLWTVKGYRDSHKGKADGSSTEASPTHRIPGTRIPAESVRALHERGWSEDQIREAYPDLSVDQIRRALAEHDTTEGGRKQ